jgi:hypothetical protein
MIIATEMCPGHIYIYLNPMGHTLKSFAYMNMSLVLDQRERETLKVVCGSLGMVPLYHGLVPEGSATLPVIYTKVSEEIRSNRSIYGKSGMD